MANGQGEAFSWRKVPIPVEAHGQPEVGVDEVVGEMQKSLRR